MSRRRQRRPSKKTLRHAPGPSISAATAPPIVRLPGRVERLAYTRKQAAEALGISRSTFDRRVLPFIETIDMEWGTRLVPVDALQRLVAERRRPPRARPAVTSRGRPPSVPAEIARRIKARHAAGNTLGQIARELNAERIPTAQGGARWWPSTVRSILRREARPVLQLVAGDVSSEMADETKRDD
jgi:hypothetical protein